MDTHAPPPSFFPHRAPLFLLSPPDPNTLESAAEGAGWKVIACHSPDRAQAAFESTAACVAVIDGRQDFYWALAATGNLGDAAEARGAALLVLLGPTDAAELDALFAAGATHFLRSPFGDTEFVQMLRFAGRHAVRTAAGKGTQGVVPADCETTERLARELRRALELDQIDVLFQPQLSIATGAVIGVEALARWQHPELGEMGAEPLFTAAIRADYLVPLSRHVQRKALRLAAADRDTFRWLRLSLNVTAAEIADPNFAEDFLRMVAESGFDAQRVTVEITEGAMIRDLQGAAGLLKRLRSGGLHIAIDDFGTGYSSLAYLNALPLDSLKIDPHLSQDIAGSARDRVVVTSVIEMARSLGLTVIAEGVETERQLRLLAEAGCNAYQGFVFAPALAGADLAQLMKCGRRERVPG